MDLAPVVDVQRDEPDDHLKGRLFSKSPEKVGELGCAVVKTLQENGVMAVAKHFPGLGQATTDPHFNLPRIDAEKDEIDNINMPPFKALIDEDVSGVMTSHAIYTSLDAKSPATLSRIVLTDILRKKIGFKGLIITDDLEMGAIEKKWGVAEGALASFKAGADMLLVCKNQDRLLDGITLIRKKVLQDEISVKRLQESVDRIMKTKKRYLKPKKTTRLSEIKEYFKL
jgi:beta-N-acetylhexosaminidase